MKYRVHILREEKLGLAICRNCGNDQFVIPPYAGAFAGREDVIGVISRYHCAKCDYKGPKLSQEHLMDLGYDLARTSPIAYPRVTEEVDIRRDNSAVE